MVLKTQNYLVDMLHLSEVMHMQIALHLHEILLKCNLTCRSFLLAYRKKKKPKTSFTESISRDNGGNDKQGWEGISEVSLLYAEP